MKQQITVGCAKAPAQSEPERTSGLRAVPASGAAGAHDATALGHSRRPARSQPLPLLRIFPPRAVPRSPRSRRCGVAAAETDSLTRWHRDQASHRGARGFRVPGRADAAIHDHMGDMNALRRQFAGHALRKPAQRELAHGERRRLGVTLDARRCAGEQNGACPLRQHAPHSLLRHQEAAERRNGDRFFHLGGIEIDQRTARAVARIIDDGVRIAERRRQHPYKAS